jgi:hypothetical protein
MHAGNHAGIRLIKFRYESKAPDSQNVSEDRNGTMRDGRRGFGVGEDPMKQRKKMRASLKQFPLALVCLIVVLLSVAKPLLAQESTEAHIGLPLDWSTRHILFTNGGSPEMADAAARDPRSWINWNQRSSYLFRGYPARHPQRPRPRRRQIRVDWAMSLGANGGMPIGESPAKYSFASNGTYSCATDFAVYTIGATPSATQANIVAFNNLYTGTASSSCPFGPQTPPTTDLTQPTFMWSYRAGAAASFLSPTLSLDGTKVAFLENSNPVLFDVLTWVSGQGTDATHPVVPGAGGSSLVQLNYTNSAAAGCKSSNGNSNSSAYIDYTNDVAYVGADNGKLYKITGVFKGVPTVQYCVTVKANALLTSPVYNQVSNQVFISDGFSVYSFTPGAAGFTASGSIAVASATAADPIILSPIVDSTNGFVYVFSAADSTNTNTIVSQINLGLTSQVTAAIGPAAKGAQEFVLDGDFDNAYFTTGPKAGAGTLYGCGTQASSSTRPSLYALSFSSPNGLMNSTPAMSDNRHINGASNPAGTCSPLLDFFDGTTDRLFVGTGNFGNTTGANLVTEWNVNTRISSNATLPNNSAAGEWGGTSAFTVDNISSAPQAASIYFGTLQPPSAGTSPCGTGNYCAVKLTQSGLQ